MNTTSDQASRKLNYHLRSNKQSIDRSSPHILTSSPVLERKDLQKLHKNSEFLKTEKNLDDTFDDNASYKNTIQSMNEKDNVNYMADSLNDRPEIFRTALKIDRKRGVIEDRNGNYERATAKLMETINGSMEYFAKIHLDYKNDDKMPIVKLLEDYEKMKLEYDGIVMENQKLKEKYRMLKESKNAHNQHASPADNVNINKVSTIFINTFLVY